MSQALSVNLKYFNKIIGTVQTERICIDENHTDVKSLKEAIVQRNLSFVNPWGDLIFRGRILRDEETLRSLEITPESSIIMSNRQSSNTKGGRGENGFSSWRVCGSEVRQAMSNLKFLSEQSFSPDSALYENLQTEIPELSTDQVASACLHSKRILRMLSQDMDPAGVEKFLNEHPYLVPAISIIHAAAKSVQKSNKKNSSLTYSVDELSDEETESGEDRNISRLQVEAALAAISRQSSIRQASSSGSSSAGTSGNTPRNGSITREFLQEALMSSIGSPADQVSPISSNGAPIVSDAALEQLREMGINDENVARQALISSGGDIQAALALIFDNVIT